ncbi:MAG: DUF1684 domain-containing protein [Bacteroidota bacterium]
MRFLVLAILVFTSCVSSQKLTYTGSPEFIKEIKAYHAETNSAFADPDQSPLVEEDIPGFKKLKFYPPDEKYRVTAKLTLTPDEQPFQMKTSTDRLPTYRKYGIIEFSIDGRPFQLSVYQNAKHATNPLYKNWLFLPFRDLTCSNGSYGGGRYIDLEIPEGDEIIVDFNKAYNPLCVYNYKYSCPVPPKENDLDIEIRAGVMDYEKH